MLEADILYKHPNGLIRAIKASHWYLLDNKAGAPNEVQGSVSIYVSLKKVLKVMGNTDTCVKRSMGGGRHCRTAITRS